MLAKVGPIYIGRHDRRYFLSTDWGGHALLSPRQVERFFQGRLKKGGGLWRALQAGGFIRDHMDFKLLAGRYRRLSLLDWKGPNAHVIEVTRRCNSRCVYCSASVRPVTDKEGDMSLDTARRVVDFIFSTPSPELHFEFQGGEPLLNWPVVKFIVRYVRRKNEIEKRHISFSLSSNLSLMDADKLDFLGRRGVNICTSLDGPRDIHDKARRHVGGSSHECAAVWLRGIGNVLDSGLYGEMSYPNAVATVTRFSLPYPERVVDEFIRLGLRRIQIGPLDPFGSARRNWDEIGYGSGEFLDFYARALDRMIEMSHYGAPIYEKGAVLFLTSILRRENPRWPSSEIICQLAYNVDGGIYPSDEGRLLAAGGEEVLRLGSVFENAYEDVLRHCVTQISFFCVSPLAQPLCSRCAYNPFCQAGRIPLAYSYAAQGSLWGNLPSNERCMIYRGVFDILFARLRNRRCAKVFESWMEQPEL